MCVSWCDDREFNSILQLYGNAAMNMTWQPVTVVLRMKKCVYLLIHQFQKAGFAQHNFFLKVYTILRKMAPFILVYFKAL